MQRCIYWQGYPMEYTEKTYWKGLLSEELAKKST